MDGNSKVQVSPVVRTIEDAFEQAETVVMPEQLYPHDREPYVPQNGIPVVCNSKGKPLRSKILCL